MHLPTLLTGFATLATALAANLTLHIPPNSLLPNPSTLPASTTATLQRAGTTLRAPLSRSNKFAFHDISPGSYLLLVHCVAYGFGPLRVDIDEAGGVGVWQTFWGNEWSNKGEYKGGRAAAGDASGAVEVDVPAERRKEYYSQRAGFSPVQFLKNPMILMAVLMLGLTVGMPYLMENMDEETKAEFEEMQSKSPLGPATNPAASIQNFDFAAWMSGRTAEGAGGERSNKS